MGGLLTNFQCSRQIKEGKEKYSDRLNGLFLLKNKKGNYFYVRYQDRALKRQKELYLGAYPALSLKEAREAARIVSEAAHENKDVKAAYEAYQNRNQPPPVHTIEAVSEEYFESRRPRQFQPRDGRPMACDKDLASFRRHLFPRLEGRDISGITAAEWLEVLMAIHTEKGYMRGRLKAALSRLYKYAIVKGYTTNNPITALKEAPELYRPQAEHYRAITNTEDLRDFLHCLEEKRSASPQSYFVIWMNLYTWLRPTENRSLRWEYWKRDAHQLRIPAVNMKKGKTEGAHIVPLSRQAETLLIEISAFNEYQNFPDNGFIFPSTTSKSGFISSNTIGKMLNRCGAAGKQSQHGFRSTGRTIMGEESDYPEAVLETQLDHLVGSSSRRSYARSNELKRRVAMMQDWADLLDRLKADGKGVWETVA